MTKNSGITGKTVNDLVRAKAAELRKEARAGRTNEEQLALLDQRPGKSLRERARLAE